MDRPKKYDKKLSQCKTPQERNALVSRALADGHSTRSAAKALKTTIGTIARIRSNLATAAKATAAEHQGQAAPATQEAQERPKPKMAASETTQCTGKVNGHQCGYERESGWTTCMFHHDQEPE